MSKLKSVTPKASKLLAMELLIVLMVISSVVIFGYMGQPIKKLQAQEISPPGILNPVVSPPGLPIPTTSPAPDTPLEVDNAAATDAIFFDSNRDGNANIYRMDTVGNNQTRLNSDSATEGAPRYSYAANKIVFESDRSGNDDIYVMNTDGSDLTRLTTSADDEFWASWSPDGKQIAYTRVVGGKWEIYLMNANGSNQRRLTYNYQFSEFPTWSRDGTKIAFMRNTVSTLICNSGNWDIYVIGVNGSGQTKITTNSYGDMYPSWSHANDKISYTGCTGSIFSIVPNIWVMSATGASKTKLTTSSRGDWASAWSQDGTKILFATARDGNDEVYVMSSTGSNQTNLTRRSSSSETASSWGVMGTPPPVAEFSGDPRNGSAPLPVQFFNQSTGSITAYSWNFGNGSTSTASNPTHTYQQPGKYTVSLTVSGPGGSNTNTKVGYIEVFSTISGRVQDAYGNPIRNLTISVSGVGNITTDNNGTFTVRNLSAGTYTLTPVRADSTFSPASHTITVPPNATGVSFVGIVPGVPIVRNVRQCIPGQYFLSGTSLPNRFDAEIDWQGKTPGSVKFILNGVTRSGNLSGNWASHTYDMGFDLRLAPQLNAIQIIATNSEGVSSTPYLISNLVGVYPGGWLPRIPVVINPGCLQGVATYKYSLAFPEPPFGFNIPIPDIPIIGGNLGIPPSQASIALEAYTDGTGQMELAVQTGFYAMGQELSGKGYGQGQVAVDQQEGIQVTDAIFGLEVSGALKKPFGIVDVIPPLKSAESLWGVGEIIKWFNSLAKLEGKIEPNVNIEASFHSTPSGWEWGGWSGGVGAPISLALILDIIDNNLSASAYGGGGPSISLQIPPSPSYLKEAEAELFAGITLQIWKFQQEFEQAYSWSYAPGAQQGYTAMMVPLASNESDWHIIPRTYATEDSYTVFQANTPQLRTQGIASATTMQTLIASNIYPYSQPTLAVSGTQTLLLWTHDDVSKPQMQGEEILYTFYNGSTWSAPLGITNDNRQDFNPQVLFDGFGNAVAVWERNKAIQSASSEFTRTYVSTFEIAYAIWDGSSWTAPALLTNNNVVDHAPVLARGNNGKLLLLWQQNPTNELLSSVAAPDTLYSSVWDGTTWSAPQIIATTDVLELSLAYYNDIRAAVVYSRDTDGDLGTNMDQELYSLTWNGTTWLGPTRLTNNQQPDTSPTVLYDTTGVPQLLWLKDSTLYYLKDSLSGTPRPMILEGSAGLLDYRAALDPTGNLVVVWQGRSDAGGDAYYAVYDRLADSFSLQAQLTDDRALEKMMAPAFANTGQLWLAFAKTELLTTTITVSPTLVIENVTTFGQSDLYVLTHSMGQDLAVLEDDIVFTPANPAPGSSVTISATVRNLGDLAVPDAQIAFYQGDPEVGGILIGNRSLALAGATHNTVSIQWSVPITTALQRIYVVADPDGLISEWDESNNSASSMTMSPDLTVANVWAGYGAGRTITLTTFITNSGVIAAQRITVTYRLDDPQSGAVVAQSTLATLGVGSSISLPALWNSNGADSGWHTIYAIVEAENAVPRISKNKNTGQTNVALLPDLVIRPGDIRGAFNGNNLVLTITVHNEGPRDAAGSKLGLYNKFPQAGMISPVQAVLNVPAGESRTVALTWSQSWWPGLYIGINADGKIPERDLSNNVMLFGRTPHRLFLPLIRRN